MKTINILILAFILSSCGGTADNIFIGDTAPDFTLEDSYNNSYTLSDYRGKAPVVIYFYPKANTPGCTTQACGVRDDYSNFEENGIQIFGISVDSKEDIKEFIDDYNLNFPLLSDEAKKVAQLYGVLNNFGFASRITFILDKNGKIAHIIKDVDVDLHANQIFKLAKELL